MNFTDYMWIKLIVLTVIAGLVSFFCQLLTGKSIEEVLSEHQAARDRQRKDR